MQNNEAALERFRRNYAVQSDCFKRKSAYFIENHESSTTITVVRTTEELPAVLVMSNVEGADEAYLYLYADADYEIGDYFIWNNTYFFAYEMDKIVKEVGYAKYRVLECNVFVNDTFWAYFKGALRQVKNTSLSSNVESSTMVPLLVCPVQEDFIIGHQAVFEDQTWHIEDGDYYTVKDIGYYYLTRAQNPRDEEEIDEEYYEPEYYVGSKLSFSTELGYYSANLLVKLVERNVSSVTILPLESGELQVTTLEDGQPKVHTLTIKENV